ncbi:MAG: SDR family oxidoreductase [Gulosibacter sp.]|uniref:SDR family oxidoreductase n=1 Tax=Gulosibacter sp. TaxID=2817531 RepID=UPI003F9258E5
MKPTALVTGASRGIGRAIAEDLVTTHRVLAGATSAKSLTSLLGEHPEIEPFVADLADEQQLAAAVDQAGLTSLDVLVNCAGIEDQRRFDTYTREDWRRSFEVNVFAVADLTARLLPALQAAKGTIVMLNSGSGTFSYANGSVYSGTKFALRTMADCLREEQREHGVRVTSVHPGFVDTDMGRKIRGSKPIEPDTFVNPADIAAAVRHAISAPSNAQVETIVVRPMQLPS